jgi:hypothetical protein
MKNVLKNRYICRILTLEIANMKILKVIPLLFALVFLNACSSDSGDSGGGSTTDATFVLNGTNVALSGVIAQRSEDDFLIYAETPDGSSIQLEFNKFGKMQECSYWEDVDTYFNFQHFNSHYFTFNLISINETTHRVKISFSGDIYLDDEDLTSATKMVSGTFDLPYITLTPAIAGLGLKCKIAGADWYKTEFWDNGWGGAVDRKFISDDEKQIIMTFADEAIVPGVYNFTTSSANKIQLAKYNTTTNMYDVYNTSGSVTITSNTDGFIRIVEGTYSFTATNPSNSLDVIQVTNGSFKTNF